MTTSMSSLFQAGLFCKYDFLVTAVKHLKLKTTSLGISTTWSTILSLSKLTEILENLSTFKLSKNQQYQQV